MFEQDIERLEGAEVKNEFIKCVYEGLNLAESCAAMHINPAALAFARRDCVEFDKDIRAAQAFRCDMMTDKLENIVEKTFGSSNMSPKALKELVDGSRSAYKTHGQMVVEELNGLEGIGKFVIRWRKHFLVTMEPKYLPKWWKVDRVFTPEA